MSSETKRLAQVDIHVFGSVALKAYLPDGDIDFALLGRDAAEPEGRRPLRDMWTQCLADVFTKERQNPQTPLRIGQVQVINAEVSSQAVGVAPHPHLKETSHASIMLSKANGSLDPLRILFQSGKPCCCCRSSC